MFYIKIFILINIFIISFIFGEVKGPITDDFKIWLDKNNYNEFDFAREEFGSYGSYGGKKSSKDKIKKIPIIFFHGNSDGALEIPGRYSTGFSKTIEYFEKFNYTSGELYVTTWGDRNIDNAGERTHSCFYVKYMRAFVEAVLKYTQSEMVNIVSHSMGVTLARKVIIGTMGIDILNSIHPCNVGRPLQDQVNVFLGLAGANYGICTCSGPEAANESTCNNLNGFFPGDKCEEYIPINGTIPSDVTSCNNDHNEMICLKPAKYAKILYDMNNSQIKAGKNVFSFWSLDDELLGSCNRVWGRPTSFIPNSSGVRVYSNLMHEQIKDNTIPDQYTIISNFEKI